MNNLGMNETQLVYTCPNCGIFQIKARVIGNERVLDTRRAWCGRCGAYVILELEKPKKVKK